MIHRDLKINDIHSLLYSADPDALDNPTSNLSSREILAAFNTCARRLIAQAFASFAHASIAIPFMTIFASSLSACLMGFAQMARFIAVMFIKLAYLVGVQRCGLFSIVPHTCTKRPRRQKNRAAPQSACEKAGIYVTGYPDEFFVPVKAIKGPSKDRARGCCAIIGAAT